MQQALTLSFWFDRFPDQNPITLNVYFAVFLGIVIVGAGIRMVTKRSQRDRFAREVARRVATLCVVMGLLGVVYWFVAFERIPFFSSRFWLVVWVIGFIVWLVGVIRHATRVVPKERERLQQQLEQKKYLPHR
ncbi:hypothetical protein HYV72_00890 [Candidatus Uhrbacteria bacterium]|nr:hypothetical protein [Candidatus Uhrbacteria bacterium]